MESSPSNEFKASPEPMLFSHGGTNYSHSTSLISVGCLGRLNLELLPSLTLRNLCHFPVLQNPRNGCWENESPDINEQSPVHTKTTSQPHRQCGCTICTAHYQKSFPDLGTRDVSAADFRPYEVLPTLALRNIVSPDKNSSLDKESVIKDDDAQQEKVKALSIQGRSQAQHHMIHEPVPSRTSASGASNPSLLKYVGEHLRSGPNNLYRRRAPDTKFGQLPPPTCRGVEYPHLDLVSSHCEDDSDGSSSGISSAAARLSKLDICQDVDGHCESQASVHRTTPRYLPLTPPSTQTAGGHFAWPSSIGSSSTSSLAFHYELASSGGFQTSSSRIRAGGTYRSTLTSEDNANQANDNTIEPQQLVESPTPEQNDKVFVCHYHRWDCSRFGSGRYTACKERRTWGALKQHQKWHHFEGNHICPNCLLQFTDDSRKKSHMARTCKVYVRGDWERFVTKSSPTHKVVFGRTNDPGCKHDDKVRLWNRRWDDLFPEKRGRYPNPFHDDVSDGMMQRLPSGTSEYSSSYDSPTSLKHSRHPATPEQDFGSLLADLPMIAESSDPSHQPMEPNTLGKNDSPRFNGEKEYADWLHNNLHSFPTIPDSSASSHDYSGTSVEDDRYASAASEAEQLHLNTENPFMGHMPSPGGSGLLPTKRQATAPEPDSELADSEYLVMDFHSSDSDSGSDNGL